MAEEAPPAEDVTMKEETAAPAEGTPADGPGLDEGADAANAEAAAVSVQSKSRHKRLAFLLLLFFFCDLKWIPFRTICHVSLH